MSIPEMKEFGGVLKSSAVVELTEAETEYVVTVVKHIFKEYVVVQFEIKNTLPDTVLENVSVVATPSDEEELEEVFIIPAEKLPAGEPGKVYVAFKKANGEGSLPTSSFSNVLKFTSKEIDPTTNEPEESGYDDEYEVGDFELTGSDYVIPTYAGNYNHLWASVGAAGEEAQETLQLSGINSIAGTFPYIRSIVAIILITLNRCHRTIDQGHFTTAFGRHRRTCQSDLPPAQVAGQDGQRRKGCCQCPDGVFLEVGCYNQNCCT